MIIIFFCNNNNIVMTDLPFDSIETTLLEAIYITIINHVTTGEIRDYLECFRRHY